MKKITLFFSAFVLLCLATNPVSAQINYSEEAELLSAERAVHDDAVHVFVVLDRSGSMIGKPINDLNNALSGFFDLMRGNSQVSLGIITFESSTEIVRNPQMVTDYERAPRLSAGGGTNMTAAFELADRQLRSVAETRYKPIVIVLTDGMPNDPRTTLQAASRLRQQAHLFVVGVDGADLNFLRQISGSSDLAGIAKSTDVYNLFFQEMALSLENHIEENSEVLLSTSKNSKPFKVSNKTGWKQ